MSLNLNSKYGVTEVFVKHDYFSSLRIKFFRTDERGKQILIHDNGDSFRDVEPIKVTKKVYECKEGFLSVEPEYNVQYFYESGEHSVFRYKYIMHVGSSRSSKSWSLEEACIRKCETTKNLRINVWRDTRTSLGDTVWNDFKKIFPLSGRSYSFPKNTVPIYFDQTKSTIEPHGADATNAHGTTQDIAWLNEPYKITKETFDQVDQRAEQIWMDLNPKQGHWSDLVQNHPRCKVIHSDFLSNPFCPPGQKMKILSYDPDNPVNVKNGTADQYMWDVYGRGLKAEKPNKIYKGWKKITVAEYLALPYPIYYGLDFGLVSPTAVSEVKYNDGWFYTHELLYKPESEMQNGLIWELERIGIDKDRPLICDSAKPLKIRELREAGFRAIQSFKGAGSVFTGISLLQRANVAYTDTSKNQEEEYDEYEWDIDRYGLPTDTPIKKKDHLLDELRYTAEFIQRERDIQL